MEESPQYSPIQFLSNASQGLPSSQPRNVSMSCTSNNERHDKSAESEQRRENSNVSWGTTAESPLMSAHVLS